MGASNLLTCHMIGPKLPQLIMGRRAQNLQAKGRSSIFMSPKLKQKIYIRTGVLTFTSSGWKVQTNGYSTYQCSRDCPLMEEISGYYHDRSIREACRYCTDKTNPVCRSSYSKLVMMVMILNTDSFTRTTYIWEMISCNKSPLAVTQPLPLIQKMEKSHRVSRSCWTP